MPASVGVGGWVVVVVVLGADDEEQAPARHVRAVAAAAAVNICLEANSSFTAQPPDQDGR